ncbi:hypothetical protein VLL29_21245, partial [Bacillus altitudinis]
PDLAAATHLAMADSPGARGGCAASSAIRAIRRLAKDERRAIFEDRSRHIALSMKYLPAVARRLHHARNLGGPFDFLT